MQKSLFTEDGNLQLLSAAYNIFVVGLIKLMPHVRVTGSSGAAYLISDSLLKSIMKLKMVL